MFKYDFKIVFILDLKVIIDFIPNHTSDESEWFLASSNTSHIFHDLYKDYYIWKDKTTVDTMYQNWVRLLYQIRV